MKKKLTKAIIILFILMVFFTILSRGIRNYSYPRVKTASAEAGVITNVSEAEGVVEGNETGVISAVNGITVASVYVTEGESIQKGSLLFQYSMDSVTRQMEALQSEKQILELQIQEAGSAAASAREQEEKNYNYAVSELERITSQQNQIVKEAEEEWKNRLSTGADAAETEEAKAQYESALQNREEAVSQAQQQVDLASVSSAESTSAQQLEVSAQQKEEEIDRMEQISEKDGNVYSETEGIVQEIQIQPGAAAGDAAMTIMVGSGSKSVTASTDEETAAFVNPGDSVEMAGLSAGSAEPMEAAVAAKRQNAETGVWEITVDVSPCDLTIGEVVSISFLRSSENYMNVLPREAVRRESGNTYFVYVVTEEESILGSVLSLEKREVDVLATDAIYAAVDGVSSLERVVTDSDRRLSDGCQVIISEEGGEDS